MRTDISKLGEYFTIQNFPRDRSVFDIKDWPVLDYYPGLTYTSSSSSSKSLGTMPVDVHCTMRKYSRINWGYYLWNAGLVVSLIVVNFLSNHGHSIRNADNVFIFLLPRTVDFFCVSLDDRRISTHSVK